MQPSTNVFAWAMPQGCDSSDLIACQACVIRTRLKASLQRSSKLEPCKNFRIMLIFQNANCFTLLLLGVDVVGAMTNRVSANWTLFLWKPVESIVHLRDAMQKGRHGGRKLL